MVFAYNYEVKAEFFDKFYLSENINLCKGDDFGIVEESVVNISAETYVSTPVIVKWYYVEPDGTEKLVSDKSFAT